MISIGFLSRSTNYNHLFFTKKILIWSRIYSPLEYKVNSRKPITRTNTVYLQSNCIFSANQLLYAFRAQTYNSIFYSMNLVSDVFFIVLLIAEIPSQSGEIFSIFITKMFSFINFEDKKIQ